MSLHAQLAGEERAFVEKVVHDVTGGRDDLRVTVARSGSGAWLVGVTTLVERTDRLTWGYRPWAEGNCAELALELMAALRTRSLHHS